MMHEFCSHCDARNTPLFAINQQLGERIESLKSEIECLKEQVDYYKAKSNRQHGHWTIKYEGTYKQARCYCSVCGLRNGIGGIISNQKKPFCPNCGAKMDEEEKE